MYLFSGKTLPSAGALLKPSLLRDMPINTDPFLCRFIALTHDNFCHVSCRICIARRASRRPCLDRRVTVYF